MKSLMWELEDRKSQSNYSPGSWTNSKKTQDIIEAKFLTRGLGNRECQYITRKKNEVDSRKGADTKDRMNVLSIFDSFISVHFYISDAFLSRLCDT